MALGGISSLDHTILLCSRMAETRTFYRDVMGFPIEEDRENWTSFRIGAALPTLRPRGRWSVCDDGLDLPGYCVAQMIRCIQASSDRSKL